MSKGTSEAKVRDALGRMDLALFAYKPPDDARNWKPADFLLWIRQHHGTGSHWLEVKDAGKAVETFSLNELRPSQRRGIAEANRLGIPYTLVVWWPRQRMWTVSDAHKIVEWKTSVTRTELMTRLGVDASTANLPFVLRSWLLGG